FHASHVHTRPLPSFPTRRSSDLAAALGQIETALNQAPNDPSVLRTAGNVFAWYDARGAGVDIPDVIRAPITDMKKRAGSQDAYRSEEHTSELQSRVDLVCRLLLE